MNEGQNNRLKRWGRRWLPPIFLLFLGWLFITNVPVFPHSLTCRTKSNNWGSVEGKFSKLFTDAFTDALHYSKERYQHHTYNYLYYNDTIYFPFFGFGAMASDKRDILRNMEFKTVGNLVDEDWGADVEKIPPHIRKIADESRNKDGYLWEQDCDLMRAVALEGW